MKENSTNSHELDNTKIICANSQVSPVLTVIITVYNSEKYLEECVESLFAQTLNSIEYIFIDDASSDASVAKLLSIVNRYPDRANSVTIAQHKYNCGVAKTRQEGIAYAKGLWIVFCDSDDRVRPEGYEKMLKEAELVQADIVGCGFLHFGNKVHSKIILQGNGEISQKEMLYRVCGISTQTIHGSLCNKIIKRSLYESVIFPVGLSYCEDEIALLQMLLKSPKVVYIAQPYYEYRIHGGSLVSGKDEQMMKQMEIIIPFVEQLCNNLNYQQQQALKVKVTTYLYRLLKSQTMSIETMSNKYGSYRKFLKDNHELNCLENLHLSLALKGKRSVAKIIGICNAIGYRIIKQIQKVIR